MSRTAGPMRKLEPVHLFYFLVECLIQSEVSSQDGKLNGEARY